MATRARKDTNTLTVSGLVRLVTDYVEAKRTADTVAKRFNDLKARLAEYVDENGEVDDKGNLWVELPDNSPVGSLKREKRVSRFLDEDATEEFLKKKRLYKDCTSTITVLDEEKILAAHYAGKISEEELDALYAEKITWAFKAS